MTETSKQKKYLMWYKVKELFSKGLNKTQIGRVVGLHRETVAKYIGMSEEAFLASESYDRHYGHKLDGYGKFTIELLRRWPFLSAPQVHDRLKENFADLPDVNPRTVFNFVNRIRIENDIPKENEKSCRPYEKQPEPAYGEYSQADFGERWMDVTGGRKKKVYFFAIGLRRSRYKYVYFSEKPFTATTAAYAHELAFDYFGGFTRHILYDQDKVFLSDENLGDLALTHAFRSLVRENGFNPVFCRKGDPESKGMIENIVKYVKGNFLSGREFVSIEQLNSECLGWLDRTANGTEHHGIHRIPAEVFEEERKYLTPYKGVPTPPAEQMKRYHVRKDNTISYHSNYYTVPTGTYQGRDTEVYVSESNGTLNIFSVETGKTIASHPVSAEKGCLIRNQSHLRDREGSIDEYESLVRKGLPSGAEVDAYLAQLRQSKGRNYRDNLLVIRRRKDKYSEATMLDAINACLEAKIFNANDLMQVAETIRMRKDEQPLECAIVIQAATGGTYADIIPEKTDINSFNVLFQ